MSDMDAEIGHGLLRIVDEAPTVTPDEVLDPQDRAATLRDAPRRPLPGRRSAVLRAAVAAFVLAAVSGVLLLAFHQTRPAPPAVPSMPRGALTAVSCIAHDLCVGVGSRADVGDGATLAAVWNGVDWTPQPTPNVPRPRLPSFSAISCASRSSCVAVGSTVTRSAAGTRTQPLAMSWNGTSWTIDTPAGLGTPPSARDGIDNFEGVSCPITTFCLAVGQETMFDSKLVERSFVEALVGGRWIREQAPTETLLSSVSCGSASACLAVGQPIGNAAGSGAVVDRWNGHAWTSAGVPGLDKLGPAFGPAVACTAADDCVVILPRGNFGGAEALRWNGSVWTVEPLPALSADSEILQLAVGCASPDSCIVLLSTVAFPLPDGSSTPAISQTADVLRGNRWVTAPVPAGASSTSDLQGISCALGVCMTAGSLDDLWNGARWRVTYRGDESMIMRAIASASVSIGATKP